MPQDRKKIDNRDHLLIGCGHAFCRAAFCEGGSHPREKFITVDINPAVSPGIVADVGSDDKLRQMLKNYLPDRKFAAVIYEHALFVESAMNCKRELLKPNGHLVFVGSCLLKVVVDSKKDDVVLFMQGNNKNITIVSNNQKAEIKSDTVLNAYLDSTLGKTQVQMKLVITDSLRERAKKFA